MSTWLVESTNPALTAYGNVPLFHRRLKLFESADVTRPDVSAAASDSRLSPARRLLVIHNPTAGRGERRRLAAVLTALREGGGSGRAARNGERRRCRADGAGLRTRHRRAGGGRRRRDDQRGDQRLDGARAVTVPALGIIPIGTTNVLSRDLRIPRQADALARLLADGRTRDIHVGRANGRYFSLMCGVGMDAHIVNRTSLRLKKRIGKLAYVLQGLRELAAGLPRRYRVEIDGSEVVEASSVIVAKSRFYGGEFQLAPQAAYRQARAPGLSFPAWRTVEHAALHHRHGHRPSRPHAGLSDGCGHSGPHHRP